MAIIWASVTSAAAFNIGSAIYGHSRNVEYESCNKAMKKFSDETIKSGEKNNIGLYKLSNATSTGCYYWFLWFWYGTREK